MIPRQLIDRVRGWLWGSRRRRIGAIGLGLGVITAAIGLPLYFAVFAGADGGPAVSPTPSPAVSACAVPTLIEPLAVTPSDDWRDLTLPPVDDCFSMVASDADAGGVALDSIFILEGVAQSGHSVLGVGSDFAKSFGSTSPDLRISVL